MKFLLNFGKAMLDIISFFALMFLLFWLLAPSIPGVHLQGLWKLLLESLAMYGFYALVALILRSGKKRSPVKTS